MLPPLPGWLAGQLPFRRAVIDVGGVDMHVMEQGSGRPVLLLHGNPTWGYLWRKVAARLVDQDLRLVIPDLIGLGLSDKPDDPRLHTLDNHVAWLTRLIDTLDLRDAIAVGQDWGGPIAFGAFARVPHRLAGLVVLNTVLGPPRPGFKATWFHRLSQQRGLAELAFHRLHFPQCCLGVAQGDRASIGLGETRAYLHPLRHNRTAPLALARMVPDRLSHPSVDALVLLRRFMESWRGPTAIVWGDRDPILGRLRRRTERLLPHASVRVTQAGHFLQEEVPDEIAAAIREVAHKADSAA